MKVRELIAALQTLNQDDEIVVATIDFDDRKFDAPTLIEEFIDPPSEPYRLASRQAGAVRVIVIE